MTFPTVYCHAGMESWQWCEPISSQQDSTNAIPCICPDNPLFLVIQSESVGPGPRLHVLEHDVPADSAHGCSFNARERGVPVSPENDPEISQKKQTKKKQQLFFFKEIIQTAFQSLTYSSCWIQRL